MATTPTPSPTSATTGVDPDLAALMSDVFADQRAGDPTADDRTDDLWSKLDDLGLARLTTPEEHGGSGADWFAAAELLRAAAAHGVATPYAEHDLLAAHALTAGGLPVDGARRTVARLDATGVAHAVAWARGAERIVVLWRDGDGVDRVADLASSAVTLTPGANAAGEPRDTVTVADLELGAGYAGAVAIAGERPPLVVSPDLSAPWVMQLRRAPQGRTVAAPAVRSSTSKVTSLCLRMKTM